MPTGSTVAVRPSRVITSRVGRRPDSAGTDGGVPGWTGTDGAPAVGAVLASAVAAAPPTLGGGREPQATAAATVRAHPPARIAATASRRGRRALPGVPGRG